MKINIKEHNNKDGINWKWEGKAETAYSNKDGKIMHGHYRHYYEDGSLNAVGTWINGFKEGAWQCFYENGVLFSRGFYKNNERFPSEREWDFFKKSGERFPDSVHDEY